MINIVLDCSFESEKCLKKIIDDYHISISGEINSQSIIIKEIFTIDDIKWLEIQKKKFKCNVICIINDIELVFDIIALLPLSIWRKKYIIHDSQSLKDMISHHSILSTYMEFKSNSNTIIVNTNDIIYVESFSHYLIIHTTNSDFRIREKLSTAKEKLKKYGFIQIHKSYLVNKKYIRSINANDCEIYNNVVLPIGKKYNRIKL